MRILGAVLNKVNNKKTAMSVGTMAITTAAITGGRIKHEKHRCRVRKIKYAAAYCKSAVLCFVEGLYQELLLNAMDACNVRQALEWSWGTEFLEMEQASQMRDVRVYMSHA